MQLGEYVDRLRRELAVAAEAGGDETRAVAERLIAALESATRLTLLEALSTAADEITRELAPGSVHLRLRGREPDFVVAPAPTVAPAAESAIEAAAEAAIAAEIPDGGPVSRINFRPPEHLKARIEEAAAREGLSVNVWLVRAASAALEPERTSRRPRSGGGGQGRLTGWVG